MKAKATRNTPPPPPPPPFEPVRLEIIFESQDELDLFTSVINHTSIHDLDSIINSTSWSNNLDDARRSLASCGGNCHKHIKAITEIISR